VGCLGQDVLGLMRGPTTDQQRSAREGRDTSSLTTQRSSSSMPRAGHPKAACAQPQARCAHLRDLDAAVQEVGHLRVVARQQIPVQLSMCRHLPRFNTIARLAARLVT